MLFPFELIADIAGVDTAVTRKTTAADEIVLTGRALLDPFHIALRLLPVFDS